MRRRPRDLQLPWCTRSRLRSASARSSRQSHPRALAPSLRGASRHPWDLLAAPRASGRRGDLGGLRTAAPHARPRRRHPRCNRPPAPTPTTCASDSCTSDASKKNFESTHSSKTSDFLDGSVRLPDAPVRSGAFCCRASPPTSTCTRSPSGDGRDVHSDLSRHRCTGEQASPATIIQPRTGDRVSGLAQVSSSASRQRCPCRLGFGIRPRGQPCRAPLRGPRPMR